jgi:hypothetical protein
MHADTCNTEYPVNDTDRKVTTTSSKFMRVKAFLMLRVMWWGKIKKVQVAAGNCLYSRMGQNQVSLDLMSRY